jgi:hypothetical protein
LSCELSVLAAESKALLENYRSVVETNYPEIQDIRGMCSIQFEKLANDLQKAMEFSERFQQVKIEYAARSGCARKLSQSLKELTLNNLPQAPNLLKSILDSMDAEMKAVFDAETQVSVFADKMAASQQAMDTLQKVHRVVCGCRTQGTGQPITAVEKENQMNPTRPEHLTAVGLGAGYCKTDGSGLPDRIVTQTREQAQRV